MDRQDVIDTAGGVSPLGLRMRQDRDHKVYNIRLRALTNIAMMMFVSSQSRFRSSLSINDGGSSMP